MSKVPVPSVLHSTVVKLLALTPDIIKGKFSEHQEITLLGMVMLGVFVIVRSIVSIASKHKGEPAPVKVKVTVAFKTSFVPGLYVVFIVVGSSKTPSPLVVQRVVVVFSVLAYESM